MKELGQMPKVSRESAANVAGTGLAEDRGEELDGYAVTFVTIRQDADLAPMLKGLPDGRCQCPHRGYVFSGTLTRRSRRGLCGRRCVLRPARPYPSATIGSEFLQISPAAELRAGAAAVTKNVQAMQGA
jgi:hypothetical protein